MEAENQTLFFRMLAAEDKGAALADVIAAVRDGRPSPVVYSVNPASFSQVPGSQFAYWPTAKVRDSFRLLERTEAAGRCVRVSNETGDDFRFMRLWMEVEPTDIGRHKLWVPHAKGGPYRQYSYDLHLLLAWDETRGTVRGYCGRPARPDERVACADLFFRPGLTYPRRTNRFSLRALPAGAVFSNKGAAVLVANDDISKLSQLLAVINSQCYVALLQMQSAAGTLAQSFEVGLVQATPFPRVSAEVGQRLEALGKQAYRLSITRDLFDEFTHSFILPELLTVPDKESTLKELGHLAAAQHARLAAEASATQTAVDELVYPLYGFSKEDRDSLTLASSMPQHTEECGANATEELETDEAGRTRSDTLETVCTGPAELLSWAQGTVVGRWDMRLATGERPMPELPDPFAPLPACSPGMLTGDNGLPAREAPPDYPLRISWDGILVDDPGENGAHPHQEDMVRRVREVLTVIWGERAEAIEQEACEMLEVKNLRDYFRKPAFFFADHLKRYSKSRRQAPIYWPLSTASGSYTLWIHYHRLTDQTLFTAVNRYVAPKIDATERRLRQIEADLTGASGRKAAELRQAFEEAKTLLDELAAFRDELLRVANLPYKPDLNDGVLITAAPLWKLFRLPRWRKDLEACWKSLEAGEYDWAHLAYSIWPDRVRGKCRADRSIAIAHGLEELCLTQSAKATKARRKKKAESTQIEIPEG